VSAAPADPIAPLPLAKSRHVGLWLIATLVVLGIGAGLGIAYQSWGLMAQQRKEAITRTGGNPDQAPVLLVKYGCVNCHNIPGMSAPTGNVGPDLSGVGKRAFIGGVLANDTQNMIGWIVNPRSIDPRSAMPVTGITAGEARDVAAYLYAQP
jgi:cytochrome c